MTLYLVVPQISLVFLSKAGMRASGVVGNLKSPPQTGEYHEHLARASHPGAITPHLYSTELKPPTQALTPF